MLIRRLFDNPTSYRNPFAELNRMRREMDLLSGNLLRTDPRQAFSAGVFPAINLTEDKDKYYIRAELPGLKGDELDIQATGKNITITGERKITAEAESAHYHRREREAGRFSRIIELPGEVDTDNVEAGLSNGILTIGLSKAEVAKPRQININ